MKTLPTEDPLPAVLVIFVLILAGGFFTLFDAALGACRKQRLRKEAEAGSKKFRRVLEAVENPRSFSGTPRIQAGILRIVSGVLAGFALARRPSAGPAIIVLLSAALALVSIFFGDLVPRVIARSNPEGIAAALFPLFRVLAFPFRPLGFILWRSAAFIRGAFYIEAKGPGITEDELLLALREGEESGIVESKERTMVEGVFYLGDRPVGTFMTHRSEIQWLDINAPPEETRAKALEYRGQRCFPVADGDPDAIIGAAYLEDIILDQLAGPQKGLRSIMKKAQFVPETMTALKAFESFRKGETNFLFVMDEYGGFAGLISVRDLMEEIVGELSAAPQEENPIVRREDGSWLVDGSLNIDEAAELLSLPGLAAEHQDYHTLAGFVLSLAGEVPRTGESFSHGGYCFTVVDMDGRRIDKVLISPA
ncbi:MAG: hemolysin family protein [Treponema sp.]|jgi:putative hemolysin|nr:hemolysin family protein [Treponema sp.]